MSNIGGFPFRCFDTCQTSMLCVMDGCQKARQGSFSEGGLVKGSNANSDSVPVVLLRGEYYVSPEAYRKYGPELLSKLNRTAPGAQLITSDEAAPMLRSLDATNPTVFTAAAFGATFMMGAAFGAALLRVIGL